MVVVEAGAMKSLLFEAKKRQVPDVKERAGRLSCSGSRCVRPAAVLNSLSRTGTAVGKQYSSSLCQSIIKAASKNGQTASRSMFTR